MVLSAHHLGSHVSWGATGLTRVVGRQDPCHSEISQTKVAFVVKDEIFRLNVPMDDELCVDCLKGVNQACYKKTCNLHGKLPFSGNMVPQVSPKKQVHHKIQIHSVLESKMNVHYELALDQRKQLEFVHHARYTLLRNNPSLGHLLHGKFFFVLLRLNAPDFSKPTSSNGVYLLEIRLACLCRAVLVLLRFEVAVSHFSWCLSQV
jgi:hypothetical protein